jgi:hypothetical protein
VTTRADARAGARTLTKNVWLVVAVFEWRDAQRGLITLFESIGIGQGHASVSPFHAQILSNCGSNGLLPRNWNAFNLQ